MTNAIVNGPPKNIAPSELFVALQQQPRPFRVVDFPRLDPATGQPLGQIAMMPLTQQELIAAKAEATKLGKEFTKDNIDPKEYVVGHQQVYEELCAVEILWRACRRPADILLYAFPTAADVRRKCTSDEVAVLMQSYAIVQVELGPIIASMTEPEMDAWLKKLAEGASAIPLALASSDFVRALLMHSAKRLHTSPTESGSSGTPADDNTSNESGPWIQVDE